MDEGVRSGVAEIPTGGARPSQHWPVATLTSAVLIVTGLALRAWQYLADTSLWYDDLSIARNIHERSLADLLLHPLGYDQIAPLGFLALVKAGTLAFGESDLALRIFPFLCGVAALILFWRVAVRAMDGLSVPIAVGLFALAIPLIRYTTEIKQYSTDIVVTLSLTLVALGLRDHPATMRRCVLAGLAGWVAIVFSQSAVLVMAGVGAALCACWLVERDTEARRPVVITVPIWALASLVGIIVSRRCTTPGTLAFMHAFWTRQRGFLPHQATIGQRHIVGLGPSGSVLRRPVDAAVSVADRIRRTDDRRFRVDLAPAP